MPRRKRGSARKTSKRSRRTNRASGGSVRVKGHSRSPRGPDTKNGKKKPRPRVRSYRRRPPSK